MKELSLYLIMIIASALFCIFEIDYEKNECVNSIIVASVTPIGHRASTSYYITYIDGSSREIYLSRRIDIPVVGQQYCKDFNKVHPQRGLF